MDLCCCVYTDNLTSCPSNVNLYLNINEFNTTLRDILNTNCENAKYISFIFVDDMERQTPYFNLIKARTAAKLTLEGIGEQKRVIMDGLFNFAVDICIKLSNVVIRPSKYMLISQNLELRNFKILGNNRLNVHVIKLITDFKSIAALSNIVSKTIKIYYDTDVYNTKYMISIGAIDQTVDLEFFNITGNVDFAMQYHGFTYYLNDNDNFLSISMFSCGLDITSHLVSPDCSLKMWMFLMSHSVLNSNLNFCLKHDYNVYVDHFPKFDKVSRFNINIKTSHKLNYVTNSESGIINLNIENTTADITLLEGSTLSSINSKNSYITYNTLPAGGASIIKTIKCSNTIFSSLENSIANFTDIDSRNSSFFGKIDIDKELRIHSVSSYIEEVFIYQTVTIYYAQNHENVYPTLIIDKFSGDKTFNYLIYDFRSISLNKAYKNVLCSKQKDFYHNITWYEKENDALRVHPYVRLFERRRITLSILRDSLVYFLDEYAIKFDFYLINILHIIYTCSCKNFFPKSSGIKGFLNFKNFFRIFSKKKIFSEQP